MRLRSKIFATLAVASLAAPASALAMGGGAYTQPHPNNGNHNGQNKGHKNGNHGNHGNPVVTYVFKGTYNGSGAYTATSSVHVNRGNHFVKRQGLVGQDVSFDLTNAKVVVADTNGDGSRDLADVNVGDKVVVKARLRKKDPGDQPFNGRQLVDQSHPAV
jgi:hypothetical protein